MVEIDLEVIFPRIYYLTALMFVVWEVTKKKKSRRISKNSAKKPKKLKRKLKLKQSDLPELRILDGVIKRVYDFKYLVENVGSLRSKILK